MSNHLEKLDALIAKLDHALGAMESARGIVERSDAPLHAHYRILAEMFAGIEARKPRAAEVLSLVGSELVMRSQQTVVRNTPIEITIPGVKDAFGETLHVATGVVGNIKRISGTYEVTVRVDDLQEVQVPVHGVFMQFVKAHDRDGWNRWCADLSEGPSLPKLDLTRADLSGYDLCCADLSGSILTESDCSGANLAGANLKGCNLEGVIMNGTDLFRTRLPRKYMDLLLASGMVEVESVILV